MLSTHSFLHRILINLRSPRVVHITFSWLWIWTKCNDDLKINLSYQMRKMTVDRGYWFRLTITKWILTVTVDREDMADDRRLSRKPFFFKHDRLTWLKIGSTKQWEIIFSLWLRKCNRYNMSINSYKPSVLLWDLCNQYSPRWDIEGHGLLLA